MKHKIKQVLDKYFGIDIRIKPDKLSAIHNENLLGLLKRSTLVLQSNRLDILDKGLILDFCHFVINYEHKTYSQLFQDLAFLFFCSGEPINGTYLEVGVGDGINHSNTYLLEKKIGIKGILIEADPRQTKQISKFRGATLIKCIAGSKNDVVSINLASIPELSWVGKNKPNDNLFRSSTKKFAINSRTLDSILEENLKENTLDYLSIDVEGYENEVLLGFSLNRWQPKFINIEHNRDELQIDNFKNFFKENYTLVLESISDCDFWFVRNDIYKKNQQNKFI